ncbi:MAG: hypothetical protein QOK29_2408 [Rhodospirillaceae bacterium]|nr:hypothetical protein [Rhodospirillaceae bacterium]
MEIADRYAMTRAVIVGAGPAGISAAAVLVAYGIRPILLDEGRLPGGQAYRRPSDPPRLSIEALLGTESAKYRRIHRTFEEVRPHLDYQSESLVWSVFDREVHALRGGRSQMLRFDALILATGAIDRVFPIEGWTLPGVVTLGAAQILLKDQGCLIGRRVVFCGSSPLLYLAALQYRRMGAEVMAVLDTTSFASKFRASPRLLASPATLGRGLGYLAALRRLGVPVRHGVRLRRFEGAMDVEAVLYRDGAGDRRIGCDTVAMGFGLRPETQLAELAGCRLDYDPHFRQWLPVCDADGRSVKGVYLAGDGSAVGGADAAEISGRLAAYAVLEDVGISTPLALRRRLRCRLARLRRFQRGLATAFAWPHEWIRDMADDSLVCRCEEISAGALRQALRAPFGPTEVNRLKAFTRCGMGRCQGRFCGHAAGELAAAVLGRPHREMGWMRAQGPVKPLPVSTLFGG